MTRSRALWRSNYVPDRSRSTVNFWLFSARSAWRRNRLVRTLESISSSHVRVYKYWLRVVVICRLVAPIWSPVQFDARGMRDRNRSGKQSLVVFESPLPAPAPAVSDHQGGNTIWPDKWLLFFLLFVTIDLWTGDTQRFLLALGGSQDAGRGFEPTSADVRPPPFGRETHPALGYRMRNTKDQNLKENHLELALLFCCCCLSSNQCCLVWKSSPPVLSRSTFNKNFLLCRIHEFINKRRIKKDESKQPLGIQDASLTFYKLTQ